MNHSQTHLLRYCYSFSHLTDETTRSTSSKYQIRTLLMGRLDSYILVVFFYVCLKKCIFSS